MGGLEGNKHGGVKFGIQSLKCVLDIPGTGLSSILSLGPSKTRSFPIKTVVIWVPGMYYTILIYVLVSMCFFFVCVCFCFLKHVHPELFGKMNTACVFFKRAHGLLPTTRKSSIASFLVKVIMGIQRTRPLNATGTPNKYSVIRGLLRDKDGS